ncbi:MAG: rhomboid family intramembrane serine protease [Acidobacteria bacterium]|nr:rhomboid family intramembrane serine protease [Acidobacteriota bacterium]
MMTDGFKKLCEALGIRWVWWQWRWMSFKRRAGASFSLDHNIFRRLRSRQKVCRRCGAIAAGDQSRCGSCGRPLPSQVSWFLYKVFGLAAPGIAVATGLLSGLILLDFAVVLARGGPAVLGSPSIDLLLRMGAMYPPAIHQGEWWRLFTCVFLHIGIIHLAFNMMALLSVSRFLEQEIGFHRYLSLFLLAGLGGSAASFVLRSTPVTAAGASGALFGLIGFAISYFRRARPATSGDVRRFMTQWAIYGFLFGFFIGADNLAHAGGFVTGLLLGQIMEFREEQKQQMEWIWRVFAWGMTALYAFAFVSLAS